MSKKRTRQQKAKTEEQRSRVKAPPVVVAQELQVQPKKSFAVEQSVISHTKTAPAAIPPMKQSLLRVDQAYLMADLRRSVVVSLILFAVLIGIFWLVRYNGLTILGL